MSDEPKQAANTIPYERFQTVNEQRKEAEQTIANLKAQLADVQKQATTVRGINSNVGGLQALASQNMQVQALLGDISSSIAQANANAVMHANNMKLEAGKISLATSSQQVASAWAMVSASAANRVSDELLVPDVAAHLALGSSALQPPLMMVVG